MRMALTNEELIKYVQGEIIKRGENPYYPVEQHLQDIDLVADLEILKLKYKTLRRDVNECI